MFRTAEAITAAVLGKHLPKGDVRTSNGDSIDLLSEQIRYATLDAWVALEIYFRYLGAKNQKKKKTEKIENM